MHAHTEAHVDSMYNRRGYQRNRRQEVGEGPVVHSRRQEHSDQCQMKQMEDILPHLPTSRG